MIIELVDKSDFEVVGHYVHAMETELWPEEADKLDRSEYIRSAEKLLAEDGFWAFQATMDDRVVGVITLTAKRCIYAGGEFGEMMEFYVLPEYRSKGVGVKLVDAVREFGQCKGWPFLEVGAPSQPKWVRTYEFYKRYGFKDIGPRLELGMAR